jgi:hypothetical protein
LLLWVGVLIKNLDLGFLTAQTLASCTKQNTEIYCKNALAFFVPGSTGTPAKQIKKGGVW